MTWICDNSGNTSKTLHFINYFIKLKFEKIKDALLALADCYWFGFKRQTMDKAKAFELYKKAVNCHQPEAMTALAMSIYGSLMLNEFDLYPLDEIPKGKITPSIKEKYAGIWEGLLEKAAVFNLVSPFLIFQANQAEKLGLWSLTKNVKYIINKHKAGETIEFPFKSTLYICDNDECGFCFNIPIPITPCQRCLKRKYCSERCNIFFNNCL
jgi:hypothetical protein